MAHREEFTGEEWAVVSGGRPPAPLDRSWAESLLVRFDHAAVGGDRLAVRLDTDLVRSSAVETPMPEAESWLAEIRKR